MPLILGTNSIKDTGYDVANSCRFNFGDNPTLKQTVGTYSNAQKGTFSFWFKRGNTTSTPMLFSNQHTNDNNRGYIILDGDRLVINNQEQSVADYSNQTSALFRDHSAWYHVVITLDATESDNADRLKVWVNGTRVTSWSTYDGLPASRDLMMFTTTSDYHGLSFIQGSSHWWEGYMAECAYCDGQAYDNEDFGEFDSDSPTIWKPKDLDGLTFGNNGWWMDFEDSSALGNDVSGNNNDFTVANLAATDQSTDTPTNNFATFNPLVSVTDAPTFTEGNCKIAIGSAGQFGACSTVGLTAGKWYAEFVKSVTSDNDMCVGITSDLDDARSDNHAGHISNSYSYRETGVKITGASESSYGDSYDTDDVIGVALNLDDNELTFYKDNTAQNSGTAISITAAASTTAGAYFLTASCSSASQSGTWDANFGGCSAFTLSSAESDANGYGNFEFAPPSGFLAICTKNLGSDGG